MKYLSYFFLILAFFVACSGGADVQDPPCDFINASSLCEWSQPTWECMNMSRPDDSYNYPLCPDMEEWKSLVQ